MQGIKGYVFDVDGTMLDTYEHIVTAFEHTLNEHELSADRDIIRSVIGMTLHDCYVALVPEHSNHNLLAETHHQAQQTPEMYELITVYDGLISVLDLIHQRGNRAFVVTNRSRASLELIFDHVGLSNKFEFIITKDEVAIPKPDPEGILAVARLSTLKPIELAMVGDTAIDVIAGKNALVGATIAMSHGFGTLDEIKAAKPDYIFDSFAKLREAIDVA